MLKKLLLIKLILVVSVSFAQYTTGTVSLTGSNRTIKIDTDATTVTMTLTGPSSAWLGVGFGGNSMGSVVDMFIWNSSTNRDYQAPGGQTTPLPDADQSWTIQTDDVSGSTRTVVATRPLATPGDYTFINDSSNIFIIFAQGSSTALSYHGGNPHAAQVLSRSLGVNDISLNASQIYPNPSNGDFYVKTKTNLEKINIYTQIGSFVKTINVDDSSDSIEVNANGLQSGVYLIELVNSNEKSWKKIIIE